MIYNFDLLYKDTEFTGVSNLVNSYVSFSDNWTVNNVQLFFDYAYSEHLNRQQSYAILKINDIPIKTIRLADIPRVGQLTFNLPLQQFNKDINSVSIDLHTRTQSSDICEDYNNNANWFLLNDESSVNVNYNKTPFTTILEFAKYVTNYSDEINFIQDNNINYILNTFLEKDINIVPVMSNNSEYIYINNYNSMSDTYKNKVAEPQGDEILFQLINQPNNNNNILVITSKNDDSLYNVTTLVNYLETNTSVLDSRILRLENQTIEQEDLAVEYKLMDDDIYLEGTKNVSTTFNIPYPINREIAKGSSITINNRYSNNLDFDNSLLTIYVNNQPIGSHKLSAENSDNDIIEIPIPETVDLSSGLSVTLDYVLELNESYCNPNNSYLPWVYIDDSSIIDIRSNAIKTDDLHYFPYPFVIDGDLTDTTIVIPNNISLDLISTIYNTIYPHVNSTNGHITIITPEQLSTANINSNFLIVGTPTTNSYANKLIADNDIVFSEAIATYVPNQINEDKSMILIAGNTDDDLQNILEFMSDTNNRSQIHGQTFNYAKENIVASKDSSKYITTEYIKNTNEQSILGLAPLFFTLFVCFIIIVILLINSIRQKRKGGKNNAK